MKKKRVGKQNEMNEQTCFCASTSDRTAAPAPSAAAMLAGEEEDEAMARLCTCKPYSMMGLNEDGGDVHRKQTVRALEQQSSGLEGEVEHVIALGLILR